MTDPTSSARFAAAGYTGRAVDHANKTERIKLESGVLKERIGSISTAILKLEEKMGGGQSLTKSQKEILTRTKEAVQNLPKEAKTEFKSLNKQINTTQKEIETLQEKMGRSSDKINRLGGKQPFWRSLSQDKITQKANQAADKMEGHSKTIESKHQELQQKKYSVSHKVGELEAKLTGVEISGTARMKEAGKVHEEYTKAKETIRSFEKEGSKYSELLGFETHMKILKSSLEELKQLEKQLAETPINLNSKEEQNFLTEQHNKLNNLSSEIASTKGALDTAFAEGTKKPSIRQRISQTFSGIDWRQGH